MYTRSGEESVKHAIRMNLVPDIAEWQEKYKEIGRDNQYTEEQIEEYGEHIAHLARIAEHLLLKKVS